MDTRKCSTCLQIKATDQFYNRAKKTRYTCKVCQQIEQTKHRLKRLYGLSPIEYQHLYLTQQGKCKICGTAGRHTWVMDEQIKPLVVDHCHKTGKVRGLLCQHCNLVLGKMNDDPVLLENAAKYLREGTSRSNTE